MMMDTSFLLPKDTRHLRRILVAPAKHAKLLLHRSTHYSRGLYAVLCTSVMDPL